MPKAYYLPLDAPLFGHLAEAAAVAAHVVSDALADLCGAAQVVLACVAIADGALEMDEIDDAGIHVSSGRRIGTELTTKRMLTDWPVMRVSRRLTIGRKRLCSHSQA